MKKLYTKKEYKRKHKRKILTAEQKINRLKYRKRRFLKLALGTSLMHHEQYKKDIIKHGGHSLRQKPTIFAPEDFRMSVNTEGCVCFFRDIREKGKCSFCNNKFFMDISLHKVKQIDYATINALIAISRDLKNRKIATRSRLPEDESCRRMMIESGYLNYLFNSKGEPFPKASRCDTMLFQKGSGVLSVEDNKKISDSIKNAVLHLTGFSTTNTTLKSLLLEICGNSIEHANTKGQQWLLGLKYYDDKVVFSVTDVGDGILNTLYFKFKYLFTDKWFGDKLTILEGAFDKKYGSNTQESNRNKGLPSIKHSAEKRILRNLMVITNNVILHFDEKDRSEVFPTDFMGTLYQWEITKDSILLTEEEDYLQ